MVISRDNISARKNTSPQNYSDFPNELRGTLHSVLAAEHNWLDIIQITALILSLSWHRLYMASF